MPETMNTNPEDDVRNEDLAAWRVAPPRNPSFRAAVWGRIRAAGENRSWGGYVRSHAALVTAALALALAAGALAGRESARVRAERDRNALAAAYVHALDGRWMR
jgi:hypothetical protein